MVPGAEASREFPILPSAKHLHGMFRMLGMSVPTQSLDISLEAEKKAPHWGFNWNAQYQPFLSTLLAHLSIR